MRSRKKSRKHDGHLHHSIDKKLTKIGYDSRNFGKKETHRFMVLIDIKEATGFSALSKVERDARINLMIKSADDVNHVLWPSFYRHNLAKLKAATPERITGLSTGAVPFGGSMLALIFQAGAIKRMISHQEWQGDWQKNSFFIASAIAAITGVFEVAEAALLNLKSLRLMARIRYSKGAVFAKNTKNIVVAGGRLLGAAAAMIFMVWDAANMIDYAKKGKYDLVAASFVSFVGNGSLGTGFLIMGSSIFIKFSPALLALGPILIKVGLVLLIGAAIYMWFKDDDAVQQWLQSCLWRKMEKGLHDLPEIYPTQAMELDAFNALFNTEENSNDN